MLRSVLIGFGLLISSTFASAELVDQSQPYEMMKEVAEISFARLKEEQPLVKEDPDYLKTIVEEELMPYVNERYAALKVIGPQLKKNKREDVLVFIDAFRGYLVASIAQVLTEYTDQTIEFGPEPQLEESRRITGVKVDIVDTPRPNIKLEFTLRRSKDGKWEAIDMIAEGVSLISSKQSEWSGKIRQEGVLAVAKDLERLAAKPIQFESKAQ